MLTSSHSSAVAVALCVTLRAQRESPSYSMRHYVANRFHPIPLASAPKAVCETFALARGVVPMTTTVGALLSNRRQHSSFAGSPAEFLKDVEISPTLVFFYKPVCEPCKVIRERLIHSVSHPFEAIKTSSTHPTKRGTESSEESQATTLDVASPGLQQLADIKPGTSGPAGTSGTGVESDTLSVDDIMSTATRVMNAPPLETIDVASDDKTEGLCEEDAVICQRIKNQLREQLSDYADRIRIIFVDTNANPRVTALHDIRSLPTFVAYIQGRPIGRVEGAHEEELMTLLRRLVDAAERGVVEPDETL